MVEACAVGIPDATWGQRVAAVVRTRAPASNRDLDRHCRERLAPFEVPRLFIRAEVALPRTPLGKLRREVVRAACRPAPDAARARGGEVPALEAGARAALETRGRT